MIQEGLLLINKPSGPTSYDMIRRIKRILKNVKIGHTGTLDPLASGLLIILLGKATKRQSEIMGQEKTYRCRMKLGIKTDTGDTTGQVTDKKPIPVLNEQRLTEIAKEFLGPQQQIPPMYSALKKEGTPLYKLARKGEVVERQPRPINIYSMHIHSFQAGDTVEFTARCSSGTYVRVLAEDFGARLGTVATMSGLVREAIGPYSLEQALHGDLIAEKSADDLWKAVLAPAAAA